eukprot:m.284606 g.284606  ORF g.284606 m.284606 type:complete len:132 (+) comp19909_c0_seq1:116-511(+)
MDVYTACILHACSHSARRLREHHDKMHALKEAKESERKALEQQYSAPSAMPSRDLASFDRNTDGPMVFHEVHAPLIEAVVNNDADAADALPDAVVADIRASTREARDNAIAKQRYKHALLHQRRQHGTRWS